MFIFNLLKQTFFPGYYKPNRKKVYDFLAVVFQQVFDDMKRVFNAFFFLFADMSTLKRQAQALYIPVFPADTAETLGTRLNSAAFHKERAGQRIQVREFLDIYAASRYTILEYPKMSFRVGHSQIGHAALCGGARLVILIQNLTQFESEIIFPYLDSTLDPDLEIHVISKGE